MRAQPGSFLILMVLALPVEAGQPATTPMVDVPISPQCNESFYPPDFIDRGPDGKTTKKVWPRPNFQKWDPANAKPMVFRDHRSRITFYVETDGRHLAAIDAEGKLLWVRNPFEESGLCPYRTPRPVIFKIEEPDTRRIPSLERGAAPSNSEHMFIRIQFDSSQFGLVDETTGDFRLEGQN